MFKFYDLFNTPKVGPYLGKRITLRGEDDEEKGGILEGLRKITIVV